MGMNKEKQILLSIISRKKSIGIIILGIFLVFILTGSILYLLNFEKIKSLKSMQFIMNIHSKHEIFTYLKSVQAIETDFYGIVNHDKIFSEEGAVDEKSQISYFKEAIPALEKLMLALSRVDTNPVILENYQLFSEEIMSIRDMMVEKKFGLEHGDNTSHEKAKKYMERYALISHMRRENLKSLFDRYRIPYIDLGDKIKYKVK